MTTTGPTLCDNWGKSNANQISNRRSPIAAFLIKRVFSKAFFWPQTGLDCTKMNIVVLWEFNKMQRQHTTNTQSANLLQIILIIILIITIMQWNMSLNRISSITIRNNVVSDINLQLIMQLNKWITRLHLIMYQTIGQTGYIRLLTLMLRSNGLQNSYLRVSQYEILFHWSRKSYFQVGNSGIQRAPRLPTRKYELGNTSFRAEWNAA